MSIVIIHICEYDFRQAQQEEETKIQQKGRNSNKESET